MRLRMSWRCNSLPSTPSCPARALRLVVFLVGGESKRRAVHEWRAGNAVPARAILPAAGVDVLLEAGLLLPSSAPR